MAGGLPRVDIVIHLVTEATERCRFRKLEQGHGDDEKGDYTEEQENFYPFDVFLGPILRLIEKINPEILYQMIKILQRFHESPSLFATLLHLPQEFPANQEDAEKADGDQSESHNL